MAKTYIEELVAFMEARAKAMTAARAPAPQLSPEQALAEFRALNEPDQMSFIRQAYFAELRSIAPSPGSTLTVGAGLAPES